MIVERRLLGDDFEQALLHMVSPVPAFVFSKALGSCHAITGRIFLLADHFFGCFNEILFLGVMTSSPYFQNIPRFSRRSACYKFLL